MASINLTKREHSISLTKGATINLTKASSGLKNILIGLSWKPANPKEYNPIEKVPTTFGAKLKRIFCGPEYVEDSIPAGVKRSFDLDAYAVCLVDGRCKNSNDIVYYGNRYLKSGAIKHMGDNLVGGGDGDDEQIIIDLERVPSEYDKILIGVNIFNAIDKEQDFGLIKGTSMRIVDTDKNEELCSYKEDKISHELADCTNMYFGVLYRDKNTNTWSFEALGTGSKGQAIEAIAMAYNYNGNN